jgi:hypothetical protein
MRGRERGHIYFLFFSGFLALFPRICPSGEASRSGCQIWYEGEDGGHLSGVKVHGMASPSGKIGPGAMKGDVPHISRFPKQREREFISEEVLLLSVSVALVVVYQHQGVIGPLYMSV